MNSIPVLGIPHLNRPDLLVRCIESIDYPVDHLVIVQNGPDSQFPERLGTMAAAHGVKKCTHIKHPNAGVAGSWNEILRLFCAPWHMICGQDMKFAAGDLARMANTAWSGHKEYSMFFGSHGYSMFIITRRGVDRVGLFDECLFWPAYLEDTDHFRRLHLVREKYMDVPGVSSVHGEMIGGQMHGSRTINSDKVMQRENMRTHGNGFRKYVLKWGGMPGKEEFDCPFNNPNLPMDYMHFDPSFREEQQWSA